MKNLAKENITWLGVRFVRVCDHTSREISYYFGTDAPEPLISTIIYNNKAVGYSTKGDMKVTYNMPNSDFSFTFYYTLDSQLNKDLTTQEKQTMTTRNMVTVILVDEDPNLPVESSLVHKFKNVMTEDDEQTTIMQIVGENDMAAIITKHNKVRANTFSKTILERTGKEVALQPVKLKDLTWKIK